MCVRYRMLKCLGGVCNDTSVPLSSLFVLVLRKDKKIELLLALLYDDSWPFSLSLYR